MTSLVLAAEACSSPQPEQQSTTTQSNTLTFQQQGPGPYPAVSYTFSGQYSVSSGQPWGGVTNCGPTSQQNCAITVMAGRHQTSEVSTWFQSQGQGNGSCTKDCGVWPPNALNFAINGTLQINGNNYPLTVGQGSQSGGLNNWWYTGSNWFFCTANTTSGIQNQQGLCTPDGQFLITGIDFDSFVGIYGVAQMVTY